MDQYLGTLLTFQMSELKLGVINRDYNATKNMYKIVESIIRTGKRPENFTCKPKKPKSNGIKTAQAISNQKMLQPAHIHEIK